MALYLPKLRYLLTYYINLRRDFFDKIKSSHTCFNHKKLKHQLDIVDIVIYHKIVKTELWANNEVCNNKNRAV